MTSICAVECPEDGLSFDLASMAFEPIRADEEYAGQRVRVTAVLGKAQIRFQIDFGFGDAAAPPPEEHEFPTLLAGLPAPRVRAYRRETSIAEKFEAMVKLGRRNSRMKDFHDVWALSSAFPFDGAVLRTAVAACFEHRRTALSPAPPDVLGTEFYEDAPMSAAWSRYFGSGAFTSAPPPTFTQVGERLRSFLGPLHESLAAKAPFLMHWTAGGPWRPIARGGEGRARS